MPKILLKRHLVGLMQKVVALNSASSGLADPVPTGTSSVLLEAGLEVLTFSDACVTVVICPAWPGISYTHEQGTASFRVLPQLYKRHELSMEP